MGKVSEAGRRASDKYLKEKTDDVTLRLPKGAKQVYQDHAKAMGESMNTFIQRGMKMAMEADLAAKK